MYLYFLELTYLSPLPLPNPPPHLPHHQWKHKWGMRVGYEGGGWGRSLVVLHVLIFLTSCLSPGREG